MDTWPNEFAKHSPSNFDILALRKDSWTVARKAKEANEFLENASDQPKVLVLNFESAWRSDMGELLLSIDWDLVLIDEVHRISASGSKISLFCAQLARRAKHRLGLTGTPMTNSPLSIYGSYRFLDPGIFGTSFFRFQDRYALMGGFENRQVLGYRNEEELNRKFYLIAIRYEKKDVLDLPPVTHIERTCELSSKARTAYDALKKIFVAELDKGYVSVDNALTKLLRLQQITSGFVPNDQGEVVQICDAKQKLLADVLEDLPTGEPLTIFCRYRYDIDAIRRICLSPPEEKRRRVAELSGSKNQLAEWQRGEYDVLIVQIQSGGVGIDLTRSAYQIFYSQDLSLSNYQQALARLDRPGQTRPVTVVHLLANKTVDITIKKSMDENKKIIDLVLDQDYRRDAF